MCAPTPGWAWTHPDPTWGWVWLYPTPLGDGRARA